MGEGLGKGGAVAEIGGEGGEAAGFEVGEDLVADGAGGGDPVHDQGDRAMFLAGEGDGAFGGPDVGGAGLDGDEDQVGAADGASGVCVEVGRTVDDDVVVGFAEALEAGVETPAGYVGEVDMGRGGVGRCGGAGGADSVPTLEGVLGVDVDEGDALALGKGGGQVGGERRLAGAALLLCDGDDLDG